MAENDSLYEKLGGIITVSNFINLLAEKLTSSTISCKINLINEFSLTGPDFSVFKSFESLLLIILKGKSNGLNKTQLKKVYQ